MKRVLTLVLFYWGASLYGALDESPWFTRAFEFYPRVELCWRNNRSIDKGGEAHRYTSRDCFVEGDVAIAIYDNWSVAGALAMAHTRARSFGFETARGQVRYQLLNDVVGDWVSMTGGMVLCHTFHCARKDLSTFNHGGPGLECHLAIGKEWSDEEFWTVHLWALTAIGVADVGSPWLRFHTALELNNCLGWRFELFGAALGGMGKLSLGGHQFSGYGSIAYRAFDLGGKAHWLCDDGADLSLGYCRRLYARNGPQKADMLSMSVTYPFGL